MSSTMEGQKSHCEIKNFSPRLRLSSIHLLFVVFILSSHL
ncbi:hypothetical protein AXX17_AT1G72980 [Arabidopsis thaliana]|uniref:Transmembrane protein n=1 Tax=Arabidopsis thaliana TaxID=3702 RepID=A0A178WK90_ARATH|nr:hypothetical protein AXX17_AT1G72980 [Arabidopsis thaliana]